MNDAIGQGILGEPAAPQNIVREVVGVFPDPAALQAAVEQLGIAGIDRAAISVLGADAARKPAANGARPSAVAVSDDPRTPITAYFSDTSRRQAQGVAIAVPMEIAGFGAAWAVGAAGGALLLAIGVTAASGAVGAGLGALLYHVVARRHAAAVHDQLAHGGLILWVQVVDSAVEERVQAVLRSCGGGSVHTHTIDRPWGVADSPLHGVQPDPFLEHDPAA
jgi:hypothetical protein